jgi:3-hydroxybutyryl-CoA dehydrogenase
MTVQRAGVVGCGLMGSGIVEVLARSGIQVTVVEVSDEALARGIGAVERSTQRATSRGKLPETERDALLARVTASTDLDSLTDAEVIIEAASEDRDMKLELFRRLDAVAAQGVMLASNTSSIPIVELAGVTERPDRVVGMHFFNPPPVMKLLEIVRGLTTSDETIQEARELAEALGKTPVESKDRAGFIVNWLLMPYLNSAVRMLEEDFATREDIDQAVVLGLAHPMGPLKLLDLIGLDTAVYISDVLFNEFKDPLYAPPPLLKRMVSAGYLGRKSGRGFYTYA